MPPSSATWIEPYDPTDPQPQAPESAQASPTRPPGKGDPRHLGHWVGAVLACGVLLLGLVGLPQVSSAHLVGSTDELRQVCTHHDLEPCILTQLDAVVLAKGVEPGFAMLENITQDPALQGDAHHLAHELGRTALTHYNSTTEALRHCPLTLAAGCFHGMLEAHFTTVGAPRNATDLTSLCTPRDGRNREFQCYHGLGHGLDMVAMHNLPQALSWCNLIPDPWAQDGCAGGVFMENAVGDASMVMHHVVGVPMNMSWERTKADDLQYPCDAVAHKWLRDCYWLQTSIVIGLGHSLQEAMLACDQAPHPRAPDAVAPYGYDGVCYESAGRDAANPGVTHSNAPAIIGLCMQGQFLLRGRCIYGAAQTLMNNEGRTTPGFAFCRQVPLREKQDCYMGVGNMVGALLGERNAALRECFRAESRYIQTCQHAAVA